MILRVRFGIYHLENTIFDGAKIRRTSFKMADHRVRVFRRIFFFNAFIDGDPVRLPRLVIPSRRFTGSVKPLPHLPPSGSVGGYTEVSYRALHLSPETRPGWGPPC